MKIPNRLRYNRKTIISMTNNFTLNNFFETNNEIGVIIITPKQVAISYRKMENGLIHMNIIKNMLKVLKIKDNNPIIAVRCFSYSNKTGGASPLMVRNRKITQEMYDVVNKIYERVTDISSDIMSGTAKELVEIENLEIDDTDIEEEKIIGIQLAEFIKRLDSKNTEKNDGNKLNKYKMDNSKNQIEKEAIKRQKESGTQEIDSSTERNSL